MFRNVYTKLTEQQIAQKLAPVKAPANTCVCDACAPDALSGTNLKICTDKALELSYEFLSKQELLISQNGALPVKAAYTALTLGSVILFSHLLPDSQTAFHVVLDRKTGLATIFETWFSDEFIKDKREAQRAVYFGYAETKGSPAPEKRHAVTNRLENKGIVWTNDLGVKTFTVFNSTCYSTFIELSDPKMGIPIAAPSDYIKINDELYIFSRVEAEFSGTFILEVIDLFTVSQIGVRLGFNLDDEPEYTMYCGTGEIVGQLATFAGFTDYGGSFDMNSLNSMVLPDENMPKGKRPVYRVHGQYPDITDEEARNAGKNPRSFPKVDESIMPSGHSMPDSDYLIGKELTVANDDGPKWQYRFIDICTLLWKDAEETEWHEETYKAFEPDKDLIMFAHVQTGSEYGKGVIAVLDFSNGLTTCFLSRIGNGYSNREVGFKVYFGVLEIKDGAQPPAYLRHQFTTELVGRAFTWNYSGGENAVTSMHVYHSPWGYSWTIYLPNGEGGLLWTSPCVYIKLRKDIYMMSWVEETSAGGQGTVLMNLKTMHDCGIFYGLGEGNQAGLSSIGAFARNAGSFDILKYYELKTK